MHRIAQCFLLTFLFSSVVVLPLPVFAESSEIDFRRDVRPLLSDRCFSCHGPNEKDREADLRLDTFAGATADLGGYAAVVPGKPDESALMERILETDHDMMMPPEDSGKKLSAEDIEILRKWIAAGAPWQEHWSFEQVKKPEPSKRISDWPKNEIDDFILEELENKKLKPSPQASKRQLVRRLYFDLTGLPPTPKEVQQFLEDKNPKAYEQLVDRLLASPQSAERLTVDWLDAARYADTNGFSIDDHRDMWAWRDWVISSFQENLPYNDFIVHQIAGDLLPEATVRQKVATGFLRNSMNTHEGGIIPAEYRVIQTADKLDTVATVVMGLTIKCAQCHDHKYDPISQRDYYRFYAFFNASTEPGKGSQHANTNPSINIKPWLITPDVYEKQLKERLNALEGHLSMLLPHLLKQRLEWEKVKLSELQSADASKETKKAKALRETLETAPENRSRKQVDLINNKFAKVSPAAGIFVLHVKTEMKYVAYPLRKKIASVMVMNQAKKVRKTHILDRGQYDMPLDEVTAGTPGFLPELKSDQTPTRLDLAKWLVRPDHPLTSRVAVNRYWQMIFGTGLVDTANDFGSQGGVPSHPELLDWLAAEFIAHDWDVRWLLKTMVTSSAYKQSSVVPAEAYKIDPRNRLFASSPRIRLQAEFIRDSALAVSGRLDKSVGGPSVFPPQPAGLWQEVSHYGHTRPYTSQAYLVGGKKDAVRRSMYTFWKRTSPPPTMITFDAPSREMCTPQRYRTNTPLQALVLLNSPQYIETSRELAKRIMNEGKSTTPERLKFAYQLVLGREPTKAEVSLVARRYDILLAEYRENPAAAKALLEVGLMPKETKLNKAELAAWTIIANMLLNLDETITRN